MRMTPQSDARMLTSAAMPPISMAPTPRYRILADQIANASSAAGAPAASCGASTGSLGR
jgi:hypothetical protein